MNRRPVTIALVAVAALACLCAAHTQQPAERPTIQVVSVGQPHTLFNTGRDGCNPYDIPDEAPRAFRDHQHTVHLFFTTSTNRAFLGPDLDHLHHTCDIAYKGAKNPSPGAYDDNGWLTAFYAEGNTVYALIHNEFHAYDENKPLCTLKPGDTGCAEVSISEAVSTDGGLHFHRIPGLHGVIANMPYTFHQQPHWYGYMNPSSIVKHGDFYYVMVSMIHPTDRTRSGVCVLRTSNVADPASWRGWDGQNFSVITATDPYHTKLADPDAHLCKPLPPGTVQFGLGSLSWSPVRQSYLLVTRLQKWDKPEHGEVPGAYLSESKDMIHWSAPTLLLSDATAGGENTYPALIDPNATDPNFTTLGDNLLLYTMTRIAPHGYAAFNIDVRPIHLKQ
jgi:hypothetical protein